MDKLEELKSKIEAFQARSAAKDEIKAFIALVIAFLKKSKVDFESLSSENLSKIQESISEIENQKTEMLSGVNSLTEKATKDFSKSLTEVKKLLAEIKAIEVRDGVDGKDADEEKIVEEVLSKIKLPEYKEVVLDDGKQIVEKINTSDVKIKEDKLDLTAIEKSIQDVRGLASANSLPQTTSFINGKRAKNITLDGADANQTGDTVNLSLTLNGLSDVVAASPSTGQVLTWNGANWINDNVSGGSGGGATIFKDQTPTDGGTYTLLQGTIDGVNTLFTTSEGQYITGSLTVYLNGQELAQGTDPEDWTETDPVTGTFTFNTAPQSSTNDTVYCEYSTTAGGGGGNAAGADTQVQFNDSGALNGDPNFTFNKTTNALTVDDVLVTDEVYGVGWNGSLEVPTKNALYDKIETMGGGGATAFTGLSDTFASYTGNGSNFVMVNAAETALEPVTLRSREIWVGNASDKPAAVNMSGDINISDNGTTTIQAASVDIAMLSATGTPSASNFLRGDNTWATPAGSGTVTATGGNLTANSVVLGAGTTDTKVVAGITTDGTSQLNLGVNATTLGKLKLFGNTSGDVTLQPNAVAGTGIVLTLPATTGTVALLSNITGTNSGTNTGDQTSIVGITGTKAQFNTAVTDGDIVYLDSIDTITGVKTMSGLNVIQHSTAGLTIRNPANTFNYTITSAAIAADRVLNLPLITGTDTLGALGLAQTWTATQTINAAVLTTVTGAVDVGGATSLEIPNGAGGTTVDATGEVTIDSTSKTLNFYDGAAEVVLTPIQSKSITIESPTAAEDLSMFYTDDAITITKIVFVITGSTSVTTTIRQGTDRSAAGTEVVTGGTTANSTTTGNVVTSFNDATVPADSFIWLETTALSGTPTSLNVTIFYRQDA